MKMGKKTKFSVSVLCLVMLLVGAVMLTGCRTEEPEPTAEAEANWDIDWYDENGTEFTISTMEELFGLAELSQTYDFKGQTIFLGGDIVINEGDASTWADEAPEQLWNPIVGFAGTFDGQGHTISGVYGNSIVTSLGLFTDTQKTCVIRNLNLVNSCFKNNNDMGTGSIIGVGGGKLENIYSDAVLVSSGKYVGGLIGNVKTKGENQITNCWFDGTITMDGYDCSGVGGLVGAFSVEDAINTIAHCLSTADITCLGENVGGICGNVGNGAFLNLSDSMFTGTLVYDTNKYAVVGSVVGQVMGSASIIINDTYTVDEIANRTIGTSSGYQKGNAIAVDRKYLLGAAGYQWTTLDFENYWVAQKDGMPRLGYYTEATESIEGVQKMVDVSWYDPTGASFEITNVQQLYGFAYLSRSYDFRGQTIKLGADITVNEGDASTWGENAPAYNWTPIAWYGSSLSQRFKGAFDGQGHTVSGIYAKGTENITCLGFFGEVYHGAVVKDFKLVNSYFEGVQDASIRGPVGSIAGRLRGTIEDVYSDAIIVNSSKNTGGIVGMITGSGQNTISGCWFDGKITGITRTGGILGGVYGNRANIEATIEHCLNTGDISVQIGQAGVGGICGTAETMCILYIDDCLNAGTYQTVGTDKTASKHVGTLVGTITETDGVGSKAVITDSYGVEEFFDRLVGWKFGDTGLEQKSMMYVGKDEVLGYGGYQWTSLDFNEHWAARANAVPVPVAFAENPLKVTGMARMVDYSWYDPNQSVYTIYNYQQLYGMARLWEVTNLFKDKTVKLGADITINQGDAATWGETAPGMVWEPVKFRGTFDGQGHTISGVYVKGGAEDNYIGFFHRIYQGAVVKNLKLTNSYFEGTMTSSDRGATGSIAGRSNGIIDTVYSDAIVVNSARMTGGLVGMITGEGQNVIRNSWFDGQVTGINRTGGILGGVYGNGADIAITIENCANTGDIAVTIGSGDVGGICGIAETGGTLYVNNCLNAGTYEVVGTDKEENTHIGSVFGSVTEKEGVGSSRVELSNVYGVSDFYAKLVGWKYGEEGLAQDIAVQLSMDILTAEGGHRYAALDYENTWGLNEDGVPVPKAFGTAAPEAAVLDYSWYDPDANEYIITTAEQLMAFDVLCNADNEYFADKTVKLGADITLNEGEAATWAETAPANVWTPMNFNGTFDGQGHTISGLYVNSEKQYTGFFSTMNKGSVVKNLKLTNSYIEGNGPETRSGVGSIAGRVHGTIDTVYSDAILVNSKQMTGGIAGMVTGAGENTITNCWFDGETRSIGGTGGILGSSYGQTATIESCLNTGTLNVTSGSQAAGLVGYVQGKANVTITDSLNAGTLNAAEGVKQRGTIVGSLHDSATLTLTNVYGVQEFVAEDIGYINKGKLVDNGSAVKALADLQGYGAYQWTALDFDGGSWVLKNGATPTLGAFDTTDLDLAHAKTLPDYSWYNASSDTYIISTPQQLLGFNSLCTEETEYFAGKTVKLGADITLNEGNAADWATSAPATVWTPVPFSGTFDGQGHTISGVYALTTSTATYTGFFNNVNAGAVVKNLKLTNSYIEGTKTSGRCGTGSIAGRVYGTIENVYSNAIVKNGAVMTGGIAGMSQGGTITNCWFGGTIYGGRATGGILGGAYAQAATVEHCLNTGTLNVKAGSEYVGGLIGELQNAATGTVKDSLNAGTLAAENVTSIGTVIGRVDTKATLTVADTLGIRSFAEIGIGKESGKTDVSGILVRDKDVLLGYGAYQWTTLDFDGGTWVLKNEKLPALGVFDTTDLSLEEAKKLPGYSWYDETAAEYILTTSGELLAFNSLCNENTNFFEGKTVKLGADITLDNSSENWTPITFSGSFDGQGHTISGVYVKAGSQYAGFFHSINSGAVVKNLKLVNSHIEGTYTGSETRAGVGSIVGRLYGTIENVYSNATVKNAKLMTGGIAGMSYGGTITNCWFDGSIYGAGNTGGILGGTYASAATIEHCLFTGTVNIEAGTAIGGLVGYAQSTSAVTINDSLSAGTVVKGSGTIKQLGALVGAVHANGTLTMNDAYGINEFSGSAVGYSKNNVTGSDYAVRNLADIKDYGAYAWTTLDFEVKPYWVLKANAIPGLAAFDTATLSVEDAKSQPDYSWYGADVETYVITTVAQMRGYAEICDTESFVKKPITLGSDVYVLSTSEQLRAFAALCGDGADFAGKTVQLGADITLDSSENWTPAAFGGTFDGQGYTVSGLTVSLFGKLDGATVKNLKLSGSVAEEAENSTVSNCVLTNADAYILGIAKDGTKLEHCYSDGGLIADVQGTTEVKDSLAAGTPVNTAADGKLSMTDVYGIGDTNGTVSVGGAAYTVRKLADLKGYGAYQWTTLDFDGGIWVLKADAIPALNVFDDSDLDLAHAKTLPDYSWYDETGDSHVLSNAKQLYSFTVLRQTEGFVEKPIVLSSDTYVVSNADELLAFNSLCNEDDTNWFAGKTIELGADITLNTTNAAGWASEAPSIQWINEELKGTFDGKNHTISGVYVKAGTHAGLFKKIHSGATVKNLRLVNSYIENTKTSGRSGTGSIAGRSYGTIANVYSSAIVNSSKGALMTGGIVGMIDAAGENKITNCWFDGQIYATGSTGGILGGTYAKVATIEHCLNTGTINVESGTAIGGLVGYAQSTGGVIIRDSLNAGTIIKGSGTLKQIGTIIGAVHANATKTAVANVYGASEFSAALYGYKSATLESGAEAVVAAMETFYGSGAANLDYTNYWTARENDTPVLKSFS